MMEMHSKFDIMHTNRMFFALIYMDNHVFFMLRLHVITILDASNFLNVLNQHLLLQLMS